MALLQWAATTTEAETVHNELLSPRIAQRHVKCKWAPGCGGQKNKQKQKQPAASSQQPAADAKGCSFPLKGRPSLVDGIPPCLGGARNWLGVLPKVTNSQVLI